MGMEMKQKDDVILKKVILGDISEGEECMKQRDGLERVEHGECNFWKQM